MRNVSLWSLLLGAIFLLGLGFWLGRPWTLAEESKVPGKREESRENGPGRGAPAVEVARPGLTDMDRKLRVPADVMAFEKAGLFAKASGYVGAVHVDIGDRVKAGLVLIELEIPEMAKEHFEAQVQESVQASLLKAKLANVKALGAKLEQYKRHVEVMRCKVKRHEAELEMAKVTFERQQRLYEEKAVTQQQLDEAQAAFDVAKANVDIALASVQAAESEAAWALSERDRAVSDAEVIEWQMNLAKAHSARIEALMAYAKITAPFDGVVTHRAVDRGDLVQSATGSKGKPLLTVERVDKMRVAVDIPEVDVPFLTQGTPASVRPYGSKGKCLSGKVARIASALNPKTRTMRAEIDIENTQERLMDGMYALVEVSIDRRAQVLTIPAAAMLTEGQKHYVYRVNGGVAEKTPVEIGLDDGIKVEVREGLTAQDAIVVSGVGLLSDGMRVKAVPKS